jgi:Ca2+-binding EF-hand superfamily protein
MRKFPTVLFIGTLIGVLSGGLALSQEKKGEALLDGQALFKLVDRNQDGKVNLEEYLFIWKDKSEGERVFRQMDRNRDGFLSPGEFGLPGLTVLRW